VLCKKKLHASAVDEVEADIIYDNDNDSDENAEGLYDRRVHNA
jgi:hypothetical protein